MAPRKQGHMPKKHTADDHFELVEEMLKAGHRWTTIVEKLASMGVHTTDSSLIHFYKRRKARILRRLKQDAEELTLRKALAQAQAQAHEDGRGKVLEVVSVAPVAKPTQAPALRQAEKAATPQVDPTAMIASVLESLESQISGPKIPARQNR